MPDDTICNAIKNNGLKCTYKVKNGETKCGIHSSRKLCKGTKKNGKPCTQRVRKGIDYCNIHKQKVQNQDAISSSLEIESISDKISKFREKLIKGKQNNSTIEEKEDLSEKVCKQCRILKFITEFSKHGNYKDGYNPLCENCIELNEVSKDDKNDLREKECTTCKISKTVGHFGRMKLGKFEKDSTCKRCRRKRRRQELKTFRQGGSKCCPICEKYKKSTEFGLNKRTGDEKGLNLICSDCRKQDMRFLSVRGLKRCSVCNNSKPLDNFRVLTSNALISLCRECHNKAQVKYRSTFNGFITKIFGDLKQSKNYNKEKDIVRKDIIEIFHKQGGKCNLCGYESTHDSTPDPNRIKNNVESHYHNISIDRKDSEISYEYCNVQIVCSRCNISKWLMQQEEYIELCKSISEINKSRRIEIVTEDEMDWENLMRANSSLKKQIRICLTNLSSKGWKPTEKNPITGAKLMNMFIKQKGKCALSSLKMTYVLETLSKKIKLYYISHFDNLSIDRIDSSKEHTMDNIQLVLMKVNLGKKDLEQSDYISMCHDTARTYSGIEQ